MSTYAQFDEDGPCLQLASVSGWGEFGDWVETTKGYSRLEKLWNDGECQDIPGLREEIEAALEDDAPENKDVLDVAHEIIHAIDEAGKADFFLVTTGATQTPEEKPKNVKPKKIQGIHYDRPRKSYAI